MWLILLICLLPFIAFTITKLIFDFWDKVSTKLEINRKKRLFELNLCINELEKIKEEMIQERDSVDLSCADSFNWNIKLIDKHIAELKGDTEKKYEAKVITRGNCMMCGKELTEGLFFCKECENKANSRK